MATGKRIKFYREKAGWTLAKLEELSGVDTGTINALETRDSSRSRFFGRLASAFGLLMEQLEDETADYDVTPKAIAARVAKFTSGFDAPSMAALDIPADNVAPVRSRARVPVISWVTAGLWADVADNFAPGEADDWIEPSESKPSRHAFALVVVGDSMTSPYHGPDVTTFPEGTIIVVDPDQTAGAGHFVVAKDVETQKATFKKLMYDGGRWYLKPLNPDYKTVEIDDPAMRVIGRVVEFQGKRGKL